nr:uncharacterized protein LOC100178883 [Ciona intestinalis]|eukprot:XP_002121803.3 uncharacterized protein LOC100178883 [Ciona intestinalis]
MGSQAPDLDSLLPPQCKFVGDDFLTFDSKKDKLGYGGSAVVRRCYNTKLGLVAVKCMEWYSGKNEWSKDIEKHLPKEIGVSLSLNHENIVRVHGVVIWPRSLGLVLDYIPGGQLEELVTNWNIDPLPWSVRLRITYEISMGLCYLHNFTKKDRIVHGDMKPENVLLTSDLHVKIADFGGARVGTRTTVAGDQASVEGGATYSTLYAAPEFFRNVFGRRTTAHDVYSFGMILYDICARLRPYSHMGLDHSRIKNSVTTGIRPDMQPIEEEYRKIKHNPSDVNCFNLLKVLMVECWDDSPKKRPTIDKVRDRTREVLSKVVMSDLWRDLYKIRFQMRMKSDVVHDAGGAALIPLKFFPPPKFAHPTQDYKDYTQPQPTTATHKPEMDKGENKPTKGDAPKEQAPQRRETPKPETYEERRRKMKSNKNLVGDFRTCGSKSKNLGEDGGVGVNGVGERKKSTQSNGSGNADDMADQHWRSKRFKEAIPLFERAIIEGGVVVGRCLLKLKLGGCLCAVGDRARGDKMILEGLQDLKSSSPTVDSLETIANQLKEIADDFQNLNFQGRASLIYRTAASVYKVMPDANSGVAGILRCVTQMNKTSNRGINASEQGIKFLNEILASVKTKQGVDPAVKIEVEATCSYALGCCYAEKMEWSKSNQYCQVSIDKMEQGLKENAKSKHIFMLATFRMAQNKFKMGKFQEVKDLLLKCKTLRETTTDWDDEQDKECKAALEDLQREVMKKL